MYIDTCDLKKRDYQPQLAIPMLSGSGRDSKTEQSAATSPCSKEPIRQNETTGSVLFRAPFVYTPTFSISFLFSNVFQAKSLIHIFI